MDILRLTCYRVVKRLTCAPMAVILLPTSEKGLKLELTYLNILGLPLIVV